MHENAHAGSRTRVTSMGGLYDAATLHALVSKRHMGKPVGVSEGRGANTAGANVLAVTRCPPCGTHADGIHVYAWMLGMVRM